MPLSRNSCTRKVDYLRQKRTGQKNPAICSNSGTTSSTTKPLASSRAMFNGLLDLQYKMSSGSVRRLRVDPPLSKAQPTVGQVDHRACATNSSRDSPSSRVFSIYPSRCLNPRWSCHFMVALNAIVGQSEPLYCTALIRNGL